MTLYAHLPSQTKIYTPEDYTKGTLGKYDPNPEYPFGRPNPKAPPELQQFAFMIGEFNTVEEIRQPDGTWKRSYATWNGAYFLNGYGIRDYYWNEQEGFATANLRVFDSKKGEWVVTFFTKPGFSTGVWTGKKEEDKMVMWKGDETKGSRLTFYNITKDGYEWIGESFKEGKVTAFWKESARRRK